MTKVVFDAGAARSFVKRFPACFLRVADNARARAERPADLDGALRFLFGSTLDNNTRVDVTIPA